MNKTRFQLLLPLCAGLTTLAKAGDHRWSFDKVAHSEWQAIGGGLRSAPGVRNQSLVFNGSSVLQVKSSASATHHEQGFTCAVWVNPYATNSGQQMIAAKNRYSLNEREWSLMIDTDRRYRLYVRQGGWITLASDVLPTIGNWQHVAIAISDEVAKLWIDGLLAGNLGLERPVPQTKAPLTLGGVIDNGRIRQNLFGALDEATLMKRALSDKEISKLHERDRSAAATASAHNPAKITGLKTVKLWDDSIDMPKMAEAGVLKDVQFHVIKKWEPKVDGYRWLHGVGLAWHKGKLYASYGHNVGHENTLTEEGRYSVSEDGGATWSQPQTIDVGTEADDLAVSHGVFLSHRGRLWSFLGAFYGTRKRVHTRAYVLDEATGRWTRKGAVIGEGFWPMQEPVKMDDDNWILPGFIVGNGNPAAVAISKGDALTQWKLVVIPKGRGVGNMWGESSIIVDGRRIRNIARYGAKRLALAATSEDYGQTWTPSFETNLRMTTSKPASGTLSTGQRYLVCSTTADGGGRYPLTIAVSRPGETGFSKIFVIRHAEFPDGPGESHPKAALSYPYTIEHDGKLYVGYSNAGGRGGNQNSAELAIIPISNLNIP